jgi:hypothetical protein
MPEAQALLVCHLAFANLGAATCPVNKCEVKAWVCWFRSG